MRVYQRYESEWMTRVYVSFGDWRFGFELSRNFLVLHVGPLQAFQYWPWWIVRNWLRRRNEGAE